MSRLLTIRQQPSPNPSSLAYPYQYLNPDEYDLTPTKLPNEPIETKPDFPSCISHYFFIQEGVNDEKPWRALFQCSDGRYGFYKADCDYTGFDCQGNMKLYLSHSYQVLIEKALTDEDYRNYIQETL